jgi:excisionase family DNA binding protein
MPTQQLKSEQVQPRTSDERVHLGRLLTIPEAGEATATSERFIRRLVAERRITFVKVGKFVRIPESAVHRFLADGTVEAAR